MAAEPNNEVLKAAETEQVVQASDEGTIIPFNTTGTMTVGAWASTSSCTITLDPYIGFTKKFHLVTQCSSNDGILIVLLTRKKDGKIMSNDWYANPNGNLTWSFTLPSSGEYEVKVTSNATSAPVYVTAYWE